MKKTLSILLATAMLFVLSACGGGGNGNQTPANTQAAPENTTTVATEAPPEDSVSDVPWNIDNIRQQTFLMAHALPATGMTGMQYNEFAVAVGELSGGKMQVDQRVGGTLVADAEAFDAVMIGTIDFTHSLSVLASGTITDLAPVAFPGTYSGDDWHEFIDYTRDLLTEIYAEYGIKYMGAVAQGNSAIVSTERQIHTPADIQGLAFRAAGTQMSRLVELWGGSATTIGLADLPDAMNRGIVQGVATGLQIIVPFQIYEVARYVSVTTMNETFGALAMNGERWDNLNADEQALLTEAGRVFERNGLEMAQGFMSTYLEEIEASGRNEVYHLTYEEQRQFADAASRLWDQMSPELGPKGLQLIELLRDLAP